MFLRRLFYDIGTGEILHSYKMEGALKPRTAAEEAAHIGLENWAVFAWHEPDPVIEQNFADSYGRVTVDVSGETAVLVFDFSPLPEPEPSELEQYYAAVSAALGVNE